MIRHRQGSDFLLITQNDHAVASGLLAKQIGNEMFAQPSPFGPTISAISMHDSGWPLHDDSPTLDEQGLPLHVLESPPQLTTRIWSESTAMAAAVNDYAGLLVSLHGLRLSALAGARGRIGKAADVFELNKFQHRQIEIQETLRLRLGLRIDRPLELGLAGPGCDEDEDLLRFNFRLLTAMDQISLDACCSEPLFNSIDGVHPRPGADAISIRVEHRAPFEMGLEPWPFAKPALEIRVPCRRVMARTFSSNAEFRAEYAAAPVESITLKFVNLGRGSSGENS